MGWPGLRGRSMSRLHDIEAFLSLARKVTSIAELRLVMSGITREMRFDQFALLHHVDLPASMRGVNHVVQGEFVAMSDYPHEWIDTYAAEGLMSYDPVLQAANVSAGGYAWEDLPRLLSLTPDQWELMERGRSKGVVDGYSVPAHFVGEAMGTCSFALSRASDLPRENFAMADTIALLGFQAARNIVGAGEEPVASKPPAPLTSRQLECIVLIAKGKTDWEIARILGISEETVKQHVKDARERYDVGKRIQLVVRVLYDGLVTIRDLV